MMLRSFLVLFAFLICTVPARALELTPVEKVEGVIWDVNPERLLYRHTSGELRIRNRANGTDSSIPPAAAGRVPVYGFLSPRGAIFMAQAGNVLTSRIFDWADGALLDLGRPDSRLSLAVSGSFAIWSVGTRLILRDLIAGTDSEIANTAGNWQNDVTADGAVVYWSGVGWDGPGDPTFDYNIYRFADGVTTPLTDDADMWHTYPRSDGRNVVYRKHGPCCSDESFQIILNQSGREIELGGMTSTEPLPGRDYQVNGGWTAYVTGRETDATVLWLRSPDGRIQRLPGTVDRIGTLAPNGQVSWLGDDALNFWFGGSAVLRSTVAESSLWIDGSWHIVSNGVLYRVNATQIDIEKLTDGHQADGPNDPDVPRIAPGDPVAWTYRVTNTGSSEPSFDDVVVTDSAAGVVPMLDPGSDAGADGLLSPGETWEYVAIGAAIDLSLAGPGSEIEPGCGNQTNAYVNVGSVVVTVGNETASDSDPSHYCNADKVESVGIPLLSGWSAVLMAAVLVLPAVAAWRRKYFVGRLDRHT